MFENRLRKKAKHLAKWAQKKEVSCYRLYDADMPEYAVAIDLYQQFVHIQEYAAPQSIDPEKAAVRLKTVIRGVQNVLSVPEAHIYLKVRQSQKGKAQYEKFNDTGCFFPVKEGNCEFYVNLSDYLDTGLFLDHRNVRQLIQSMSAGKRVLNLFAYTGTASVHAAMGNANHVTSVDLSKTYLAWAERNFTLNGLTGDFQFIRADCLDWLQRSSQMFDLIFLDPPSFSNSKKMGTDFDVLRDQVWLIHQTMQRLTPQGMLIFSNNKRKFKLNDELQKTYTIKNITHETMPQDFVRQSPIHQCWRIQHHSSMVSRKS